jgi:uracil-DNA glycosylase family 4
MEEIKSLIQKCSLCSNKQKQTDIFMQNGKSNFIIIGESPAKDGWIVSGKAFYNTEGKLQASGKVLAKLLDQINLTIPDIYFTECCKCIIEDRKELNTCSKNCLPILLKQLTKIPCNIILTMGLHPTQVLLGKKVQKFADVVGQEFKISIEDKEFTLIPIYHPSPLNPKGYKGNIPIFEKYKNLLIPQ